MKNQERSKRRRRNRFIKYAVPTAALLILFLAMGGGGYYTYAKYFSQAAQQGIAIASQVYFTANHAVEVLSGDEEEDYIESLVQSYSGGSVSFDFQVRNFENNLLFNQDGVEISYSVSFWLEKAPTDGTVYQLKLNDTDIRELNSTTKTNRLTIDNQVIGGGSAYSNNYSIEIEVSNGITHEPIPVYVEVQTAADSMIDKTLRGKMVLGDSATIESEVEYEGFVLNGQTDDEKLAELKQLSAFSYEIRTVGEAEQVKLYWNPNYLEIDLFDDYYLAWLAMDENAGVTTPGKETIEDVEWYYITIDVMPYSSQLIHFFRGSEFNDSITLDVLDDAIYTQLN